MRCYFYDSSILVKVYAEEPGSTMVRDILRASRQDRNEVRIYVCDLALPETCSALTRKSREKDSGISPAVFERLYDRLLAEIAASEASPYYLVESSGLMPHAADLVRKHGLRGADSVQLAAALGARDVVLAEDPAAEFTLGTEDRKLRSAGAAEGLGLLNLA